MSRTITAAVQAVLDRPVTRVGYLLSISTSPIIQICDVGTVEWDSRVFAAFDFTLSGFGESADRAPSPTLSIQNLDSVISALLLAANVASVAVDVWQVVPEEVSTVADVSRLGRYLMGDIDVTPERLVLQLVPEGSLDAFSPRRRVDPYFGFDYAMPDGAKIAWENEVNVVGADRG